MDKALRYNEGKVKWSLVHFKSLEVMVRVLMFGAEKYAPNNWKKGMNKKEILESMQRHLSSLFDDETVDSESKIHHIGHIMCNAMFYSYYLLYPEKEIISGTKNIKEKYDTTIWQYPVTPKEAQPIVSTETTVDKEALIYTKFELDVELKTSTTFTVEHFLQNVMHFNTPVSGASLKDIKKNLRRCFLTLNYQNYDKSARLCITTLFESGIVSIKQSESRIKVNYSELKLISELEIIKHNLKIVNPPLMQCRKSQ